MGTTNVAIELENFKALSPEQKKEACRIILEGVRERGGLFLDLYELVVSGEASEEVYEAIYESAMVVLSESEGEKLQQSVDRLEAVRGTLREAREREEWEKAKEFVGAEELLIAMGVSAIS